ncbi:hypothetical protein [Xanthomonas phage BUDD]|nr:hypothetical protein [Xanthomonas phage BUDD]
MIDFDTWLYEDLKVPNAKDGKGKMRHGMPQLTQFDAFMDDLKANDIGTEVKSLSPWKLTPTQGNFNEEKVDFLIDQKKWDAKPIITSADGYVVDGHHRWLAAAKLGKDVQSRVIGMNCDDLLKFLKGKSYVETKTINE